MEHPTDLVLMVVVGEAPDRVTSNKEASYPGAISKELGQDVKHRTSRYLNNMIEQDHRGIKLRLASSLSLTRRDSVRPLMSLEIFTRQQSEARESL